MLTRRGLLAGVAAAAATAATNARAGLHWSAQAIPPRYASGGAWDIAGPGQTDTLAILRAEGFVLKTRRYDYATYAEQVLEHYFRTNTSLDDEWIAASGVALFSVPANCRCALVERVND
jgi:hypothetical protein